ncbi:host cell factor-like [Teleopsis dalmanni]|uniref:host cell factor-like n=1 Tax=Teleopsis dalmanni TaxID=139649 RepID=UPI0018CEA880|nr:host cell factor-like [Teleopsis dalmanni]
MESTNSTTTTNVEKPVPDTAPTAAATKETPTTEAPVLNTTKEETTTPTEPEVPVKAAEPEPAKPTDANESATKETKTEEKKPTDNADDADESKWHTVGIFEGVTTAVVKGYIDNKVWSSAGQNLTSDSLPDLSQMARISLESGTSYRFRLRAINSLGSSDWGDECNIKTCTPGFPGAPSAIKISKSAEGAHLTWEPPPHDEGDKIVEYSVYLAIKSHKDAKTQAPRSTQLVFVRVYVGEPNQCTVPHASLEAAHVDSSNKPAKIFRIAARNEKGYGPATQVRWLQDQTPGSGGHTPKKNANGSNQSPKTDSGVISPSKRFKPNKPT